MRAFLVLALVAAPAYLLPNVAQSSREIALIIGALAGAFAFFEYASSHPGLVEFRFAPPFNRVRYFTLLAQVVKQRRNICEILIGRHDDAAQSVAIGGPHRREIISKADGHRPLFFIDNVVITFYRTESAPNIGEFLLEDLIERPIRRKHAVTHHKGLHATPDKSLVKLPVIEGLFLLRPGSERNEQQENQ